MHFATLVSLLCLIFILRATSGCHNAYHGGYHRSESNKNKLEQSAQLTSAERRERLLQEHGLPQSIIDCAVKKLNKIAIITLKKDLSKRVLLESSISGSRNKRSFGGLKEVKGPQLKLVDLKSQCAKYGNLCSDVLECALEHNLEIPQLSFLVRTTHPTTITTISTKKPNSFDGIKLSWPPFVPGPSKLPSFLKLPHVSKLPFCNCKSIYCKLRCNTTLNRRLKLESKQ